MVLSQSAIVTANRSILAAKLVCTKGLDVLKRLLNDDLCACSYTACVVNAAALLQYASHGHAPCGVAVCEAIVRKSCSVCGNKARSAWGKENLNDDHRLALSVHSDYVEKTFHLGRV